MNGILDIKGSKLIIRLCGEIDHHSAKDLREQIDKVIFNGEIRECAFDFNKVGFMDSSGIGLIMGRYRLMEAVGGSVSIFGVSAHLDKLFTVSGIRKIVKVYNCESEALPIERVD